MNAELVKLEAVCDRCGLNLFLEEGSQGHLIGCVECDVEAGAGATPADALESWYQRNPPPRPLPSALTTDVVPRHPWVIEVDGYPFNTLAEAEDYTTNTASAGPIMCRLASSQKAANQ
jgi:hypothetical protein